MDIGGKRQVRVRHKPPGNQNLPVGLPICSPAGLDNLKDHGTCMSHEALKELCSSYNRIHVHNNANGNGKPINVDNADVSSLYESLKAAMADKCPIDEVSKAHELCWIQSLGGMSQNKEASKCVMPPKPKDWKKSPRKWLNNYDIQHILSRFEGDKDYPYKLIGVVPIDFQGKDSSGNVLYPELRDFDIKKYVGKYRFLGLVTNLDTHDGPGTHWTSTFICIDPSLPCFGAYYYDSTFSTRAELQRVPPEIRKFFKLLKKQAKDIPNNTPKNVFKNVFYRLNHQKGNTECGMFSIFYQVYWLRNLIKNSKTTHKDIIALKISDDQVFKLRDFFFSPQQQ